MGLRSMVDRELGNSWLEQAGRRLWRSLPVFARQSVARELIARLRPMLSRPASELLPDRSIPRIVVGLLSSASGLGQSARLAAKALQAQGFTVLGVDLTRYFYESGRIIQHGLCDGRRCYGAAHVIVVINAPYMPYALTLLGGKFIRDKHVTGYWAWELPRVPHNWVFGLSAVHDVAVPSRFTADAVQRLSPELPVRIAPHPVSLAHPAPHLALGEVKTRPFTILSACSIASGFNRKNPLATIRAFRRAFANDSSKRLKLLVTNVHHFPQARDAIEAEINGSRNIQISWRVLEPMAFARWWSEGDVYLSLHRAEGFGLPLAEAMCAGMPAVATGWSGNVDYMDTANGYLIEYSLIDVDDAQGKYPSDLGQWAEPNIEHASAILAHLATNKASATAKACAYAASAQSRLSGKAFVDSLTKSSCQVVIASRSSNETPSITPEKCRNTDRG